MQKINNLNESSMELFFSKRKQYAYFIILLFSAGIYFNTIFNKYASDDKLVLTQNKFTLRGFEGIKDILTHDAFVGYFGEIGTKFVQGGRYRPLSIITFAIEAQFFGQDPMVSHSINVFLFVLTCLLLYRILDILLAKRKHGQLISFIAVLLFAGHPIHTEVVANIKGRDEILGLLFSLVALRFALTYIVDRQKKYLLFNSLFFFLALLSKENAITFAFVIPLTFYFFSEARPSDYLSVILVLLVPIVTYIYMRSVYTNPGGAIEVTEILNNPFAHLSNDLAGYMHRYATVVLTFLLYLKLLVFPHPLTIDYYYNQIPMIDATNPVFMLSLIVNGSLLLFALWGIVKRSIFSYAIFYYWGTFFIVSNLVFTVGALMNERFMYMPSIGYCLALSCFLIKINKKYSSSIKYLLLSIAVILSAYSFKTISRNSCWFDDITISIIDSKTSVKSAKIQYDVGSMLIDLAGQEFQSMRIDGSLGRVFDLMEIKEDISLMSDSILKRQLLDTSISYLTRAVSIYPTYYLAWYHLGLASYKCHKDTSEIIRYFTKTEECDSGKYDKAWNNIGCIQLENKSPLQAKNNFLKAVNINPFDTTYKSNVALAYFNIGEYDSAIFWYERTIELAPNNAVLYYTIGRIYGIQLNKIDSAIKYLSKTITIDPGMSVAYGDLGLAYNLSGRPDESISVSEVCLKRFPYYIPAMKNLVDSYRAKNNLSKVKEYESIILSLTTSKLK